MWLWVWELQELGLRRQSPCYWLAAKRYGLPPSAYLSVFSHAFARDASSKQALRERVDICAFHITFCLGVDRIHFYYHEADEGAWEAGGHTSGIEIRRYQQDPGVLRASADRIAREFVSAMGQTLRPREPP